MSAMETPTLNKVVKALDLTGMCLDFQILFLISCGWESHTFESEFFYLQCEYKNNYPGTGK